VKSGTLPHSYSTESIVLDSILDGSEYYTVYRSASQPVIIDHELSYNLRVKNKKVYFSGKLRLFSGLNRIVSDQLLYDFHMTAGDTMINMVASDSMYFIYSVDSVGNRVFEDGVARKVQYCTRVKFEPGYDLLNGNQFFIAEGLGAETGLSMFSFKFGHRQRLLSVCRNSQLVYNESGWLNYSINDYCDSLGIDGYMRSLSVEDVLADGRIRVYPNPVRDILYFGSDETMTYSLSDISGRNVMKGTVQQQLDVRGLDPGMYSLRLSGRFHEQHLVIVKQ
jgi:hypothetical protein